MSLLWEGIRMNKVEFLEKLRNKLYGLPNDDIEEKVEFYSEIIDDRIEDGEEETKVIEDLGDIDKIVSEIISDTSLLKIVKEKAKPNRKLKVWEIVLIACSFPIWLPILIVALVLAIVAYILIWVLVIVCYSVETSFIVGSVGGIIGFLITLFTGNSNYMLLACGLILGGLALPFTYVCFLVTKLTINMSKRIINGIKKLILKKGNE